MIQQMVNSMFKNHPMYKRALEMTNGKSEEEIKQVINNLCQQRGININEAQKQFEMQFSNMFGKGGINR